MPDTNKFAGFGIVPTRAEKCSAGIGKLSVTCSHTSASQKTQLNRYLSSEGTNLRALGNVIRFERARQMLQQTQQPITQIAYRLGYSDPISFCSAFRKISGLSPRAYRKAA